MPLRLLQEQDLRKLDMTDQPSTRYYSIPFCKGVITLYHSESAIPETKVVGHKCLNHNIFITSPLQNYDQLKGKFPTHALLFLDGL